MARVVRWAAALVYVAALAVSIHDAGLPLDRERIALWLVGALAITGIGRSPCETLVLVRSWWWSSSPTTSPGVWPTVWGSRSNGRR